VSLETTTYINGLVSSNPASSDPISQADDHLRLIKSTIKATFPNITGPVTATQDQINAAFSIPFGLIVAWYGSSGSVPSGWAICNGSTVSKSDGSGSFTTPDLRTRTIVGAGTTLAQGATGGASSVTPTTSNSGSHTHSISGGAHSHSVTVGGTSLTIAQLPSHAHGNGVGDNGTVFFNYGSKAASPPSAQNPQSNSDPGTFQGLTEAIGGGQTHTHGTTVGSSTPAMTAATAAGHTHTVTVNTMQPSMGLHWIVKI